MKLKTRFETFSMEERQMLAEAIWRRQRCYIAGDKLFNQYGKMLSEVLDKMDYMPGRVV
jgi:hypothetical protein